MLDYENLWKLALRKGEIAATFLYPPHQAEKRRTKAYELTWHYYRQYITPPRRFF